MSQRTSYFLLPNIRSRHRWFQVLMALMTCLLPFGVAKAQAINPDPETQCIRDAADFDQGNICTANDVRFGSFEVVTEDGQDLFCADGEEVAVLIKSTIESGPERRNIGLWVDTGGGNAQDRGNMCYRDFLQPPLGDIVDENNADQQSYQSDSLLNNGDYFNVDGDMCADVPNTSAPSLHAPDAVIGDCTDGSGGSCLFTEYVFETTITCSVEYNDDGTPKFPDEDGNAQASVGACTSWNLPSYTGSCSSALDTIPANSSKC